MHAHRLMSCLVAGLLLSASALTADELTGIYRKESGKDPAWLEIDGHGRIPKIPITGEALKSLPDGQRIWVDGVIRTWQYGKPEHDSDQQAPTQWMIVMHVKEAHEISRPFERPKAK